jgi:hypothetical protein
VASPARARATNNPLSMHLSPRLPPRTLTSGRNISIDFLVFALCIRTARSLSFGLPEMDICCYNMIEWIDDGREQQKHRRRHRRVPPGALASDGNVNRTRSESAGFALFYWLSTASIGSK